MKLDFEIKWKREGRQDTDARNSRTLSFSFPIKARSMSGWAPQRRTYPTHGPHHDFFIHFFSSLPYFPSFSFRNRYLIHSPPSSRWRRTETASKEEAPSSIALSSPVPAPPPPRRDPPFAAQPPLPETPTPVSPFPNPRLLRTRRDCVFEFVSVDVCGRWRECNEALTN